MSSYIQNFKKFQPLLAELVARDIKIKYRRSVGRAVDTVESAVYDDYSVSGVFQYF